MQKTCKQCGSSFEITQDDLDFYDKVSPVFNGKKELIPPPTKCPECRDRLRYTFRNERHLFRRPCGLCRKEMVSMIAPEKPYTVYCPECFFSDRWNAESFGRPIDFTQPFFGQFAELKYAVPRLGIDVLNNQNSEFTNISISNKDCYMVFATVRSERCFHTRKVIESSDSMDCSYSEKLELCYECTDCYNGYNLLFSELCKDCSFSSFLFDCIGVQHCCLCSNLRNKNYCFQNQQLSKEEYEAKVLTIKSQTALRELRKQFELMKLSCIHRASQNFQIENCEGNYLMNCKNCFHCFDTHNSEDCTYCTEAVTGLRSSMDCSCVTMECEGDFESATCSEATNFSLFSANCRSANHALIYCDSVYSSHDLFGCAGLRYKQYCIFNKQYTAEEYRRSAAELAQHMQRTGEWGQFFPHTLSPFAYNESMAQEFYPQERTQALARGFTWRDIPEEIPKVSKMIPANRLPDSINDIPDEILDWAVTCETTGHPFKIAKQELAFYRQMHLPLPHLHPNERHRRRMALRNPWKLWTRPCMKCGKEMETTYSPDRPEIVYCESCYLREVY